MAKAEEVPVVKPTFSDSYQILQVTEHLEAFHVWSTFSGIDSLGQSFKMQSLLQPNWFSLCRKVETWISFITSCV